MAQLQLAILYRVGNGHENNQENQGLWQSKETSSHQSQGNISTAHSIKHQSSCHNSNGREEQLATAELGGENWESCYSQQADNSVDNTQNRELGSITNYIDEIIQVEVVYNIDTDTINQISNSHPKELVIPSENLHYILGRGFFLVFTESIFLFMSTQAQNNSTQGSNTAANAGKGKPACWVTGTAILIHREIQYHWHYDNSNHLSTEYRTNTSNSGCNLTLMGIKGQSRNHGPDSYVLSGVENIHDEIYNGKDNKIQSWIAYG